MVPLWDTNNFLETVCLHWVKYHSDPICLLFISSRRNLYQNLTPLFRGFFEKFHTLNSLELKEQYVFHIMCSPLSLSSLFLLLGIRLTGRIRERMFKR